MEAGRNPSERSLARPRTEAAALEATTLEDMPRHTAPGVRGTDGVSPVADDRRRVAVAHEWLVRYAGSERVVEQILLAFPGADLYATIAQPRELPPALRNARTSFLQGIPGVTRHHEWFLPLMPLAWRARQDVDDVDALITSSHACVRSVRAAEGIPQLCYCHAPMRYAWDFEGEKYRFPRALRPVARGGMRAVRRWDQSTARRVTRFVANSSAVAGRIHRYYGRTASVIHPPVDTEFFTPDGSARDGFLYVGRLVGYKQAALAVEAFRGLPFSLTVIGEGSLGPRLRRSAPSNVRFLSAVSPDELRAHYRSAQALVFPADEDFGIAMAEAQACGTPVIGLASGGALDIVRPGETGWLADTPDLNSIRALVRLAATADLDPRAIRANTDRFSAAAFRRRIAAAVEEMLVEGYRH